ncbi:hypothetical protein QE422_002046 [Chryseobacterium sp. SORGH_AS 447]|uniref:hypothetical protein n=1 Tax=Chryseobacterium sp. SORGH_AS_0447 TaxID=3041769 RepID=UPI00277EE19E|nr:hypothetical protein [Chryseobacterium sp. SORGH_AS_0447]MDQ1161678.1 hypothetical protein [Chryseobacterium sp. SORGH_AS_0447]
MKKILILIIGFFFLLLAGIIIYQKFYLSPRSIQKRKIEIFEERIKEFENSKSGLIDLTDSIHLRWRIKDFKAENHNIEYCENKIRMPDTSALSIIKIGMDQILKWICQKMN